MSALANLQQGFQAHLIGENEEILNRLVALNIQRNQEEKNGVVRWLRPEYQAPESIKIQETIKGINLEENEVIIKAENERDFRFFVDKKNIYRFDNEKEKKISVFYTLTNSENNLSIILEEILYKTGCLEEYGSFAGEFNVNGTVKLNVLTCKWNRNGQESVESYQSNNDEGEL
jgi:hypothetical protein